MPEPRGRRLPRRRWLDVIPAAEAPGPRQYLVLAFVAAIAIGTALLALPFASRPAGAAPPMVALFTATSAACVTGLTVVETHTYWSGFGQGVILALIQVGGLGIMTLSSLVVLALSRRLGMRQRMLAAQTTGGVGPGEIRNLLLGVLRLTIGVELVVGAVMFLRFWAAHDEPAGRALYLAVFHAASSFNNAGFALFDRSFAGFEHDTVLLLASAAAIVVGGLGFPVWAQLARHRTDVRRWDLHTKLTVTTTLGLIAVAWLAFLWFEWSNAATFGHLPAGHKVANGLFQGISFRTAGLSTIDIGDVNAPTQLLTEVLMFIGGGSASTAGGIKVTTFALLGWVMWAEVRGDPDVVVFERRVPLAAQRQALTVALMAVGGVVASTMLLLATSSLERSDLLFETISALGTVGLSTGVTPDLATPAQLLVVALMFLGRVGPPTLFAALVLRERERRYRYPEDRPIIG
jgi:trk system potassium uptake protein TrkH